MFGTYLYTHHRLTTAYTDKFSTPCHGSKRNDHAEYRILNTAQGLSKSCRLLATSPFLSWRVDLQVTFYLISCRILFEAIFKLDKQYFRDYYYLYGKCKYINFCYLQRSSPNKFSFRFVPNPMSANYVRCIGMEWHP